MSNNPNESWSRPTFRQADHLNKKKSFGPCQPARTAQADMDRYFSQMQKASFSQIMTQIEMSHELANGSLMHCSYPLYKASRHRIIEPRKTDSVYWLVVLGV